MKNNYCCVILTTTDSEKIANLIAKTLIESKLAACVQIDKVKSFFYYDNQCNEIEEFRLMIKGASANYEIIENSIRINHNYQLPQIIKIDITGGLDQYIDWILNAEH